MLSSNRLGSEDDLSHSRSRAEGCKPGFKIAEATSWSLEQWQRGLMVPVLEEPSGSVPRGIRTTVEEVDT